MAYYTQFIQLASGILPVSVRFETDPKCDAFSKVEYFYPTKRTRHSCSLARTITTSPFIIKSALARFFNRVRFPVLVIRMPSIGPRVGLLLSYSSSFHSDIPITFRYNIRRLIRLIIHVNRTYSKIGSQLTRPAFPLRPVEMTTTRRWRFFQFRSFLPAVLRDAQILPDASFTGDKESSSPMARKRGYNSNLNFFFNLDSNFHFSTLLMTNILARSPNINDKPSWCVNITFVFLSVVDG